MQMPVCSDSDGHQAESNAAPAQGRKDPPASTPWQSCLRHAHAGKPTSVRSFQTSDKGAFRTLNEAWISGYFAIEPGATELLSGPEGKTLSNRGHTFVAAPRQGREEEVLSCFALLPLPGNALRFARMTFRKDHRGKGLGRQGLNHANITAHALSARHFVLETSRKLKSVVRPYQSAGYCFVSPDLAGPPRLARADLNMELLLADG